jgi:hypothetical protein
MHRLTVIALLATFVACAPADQEPAADTQEAAAPAAVTLADFAGMWTMRAMPEVGDSVLVEYQLTAAADPAGWTITFPGRDPIPVQVTLDGDSVMIDAGPYASVLRVDVNVSTHTVARLVEGRLVGNFEARYQTTGADSVLLGRLEGTRMMH